MGLFDEYLPDPPIACPVCGKALAGWQGKDGENLLLLWKQGERHPIACGFPEECTGPDLEAFLRDPQHRLPERFEICSYSCDCGRRVVAVGTTRDGVWSETALLTPETAVRYSGEEISDFKKRLEDLRRWLPPAHPSKSGVGGSSPPGRANKKGRLP